LLTLVVMIEEKCVAPGARAPLIVARIDLLTVEGTSPVFPCLRADSADFVTQCICFEENKGDPMNMTLRRPRGVSPPLGKNSVKPTTKKRTRQKERRQCHELYTLPLGLRGVSAHLLPSA
jgi:hypothetical protein